MYFLIRGFQSVVFILPCLSFFVESDETFHIRVCPSLGNVPFTLLDFHQGLGDSYPIGSDSLLIEIVLHSSTPTRYLIWVSLEIIRGCDFLFAFGFDLSDH